MRFVNVGLAELCGWDESRHPGIRGAGRPGRPSRMELEDAGVLCECGAPADDRHPPLRPPLPLGYGRPCSRSLDDAGTHVFTRYPS